MTQYPYIEDYLELLAGYTPGALTYAIMPMAAHTFSLARYDVKVIDSMASNTIFGGALTDKQAELAVNLVLKYRRQFSKFGIDVTPAENPQFRLPLRKIDRTKRLWVENNKLLMHFPYDQKLITEVKEYKKNSIGTVKFDHEDKVWYFSLTEPNINWATTIAAINHFDISAEVQELFALVLNCEDQPYKIELVQTDTGFEITNAADSLVEYVNLHCGGFGFDNLGKLVDYAGILGYTIHYSLLEKCNKELMMFKDKKSIHISPFADPNALDKIFNYAELTDRYPVCIYDPNGSLIVDLSRFDESQIVKFDHSGKTKTCDYNIHNVKVVYANKIPATWQFPIPLLVSTVEMMYGGKRMEWVNKWAEKIVFYCSTKLRDN